MNTHLNSMNLAIHELVLSSSPLQSFAGKHHRILRAVDITEDLHGDLGLDVAGHVFEGSEVPDHVVSECQTSL